MDQVEEFLKAKIIPELERGRPGFDAPHTLAVVDWLKKLLDRAPAELKLDREVLIIAAYAHDWGYVGLFGDKAAVDSSEVHDAKKAHMLIGEQKIKELLNDPIFSFLTEKQKERCIHLVSVHDKVLELTDPDEIILMEADTLGGLDVDKVKPTYDQKSNARYLASVQRKRLLKFMTAYGQKEAKKLIQKRIDYYKNLA